MRTTLVPSMLNTLSLNLSRGNTELRLFEAAPLFRPGVTQSNPPAPATEMLSLTVALCGEKADFYALRDAVVCLLGQFGIHAEVASGGDPYFHPGRKAILSVRGEELAQVGEIHPDVAERFGIETRVYLAVVHLHKLPEYAREVGAVKPLPKFPPVTRDIALVMDESVEVGPLMAAIRKVGGRLLEEVSLFDIYRGLQLGLGKKSVAFSLSFRAPDRTLTDAEIAKAMESILDTCARDFSASLR